MIMNKDILKKLIKSPALTDIWQWSSSSHLSVFLLCVLNLLITGCSLGITVATRGLIDGAAGHNREEIQICAILLVILVLMMRGIAVMQGMLNTKTSALLLKDMRSLLLKRLMKKKYAGLNGLHSGELVNRMFSDVNVVKSGIMEIVPGLVSMSVSFIGAAVILISMDWRFVVVLIVGGLLGLGLILVCNEPTKKRHKTMQESEGKLHAVLQETLENLRLIKASGSEARLERRAGERQEAFVRAQLKKGYLVVGMNSGMNLAFQLSWIFCMLWGCRGIYRGELTYGMLAAIIQLVGQIQGPIAGAAGIAAQLYATVSSAERLKEIMELPEEVNEEVADGNELYRKLTQIRMDDLTFSYGREAENVLEKVNICIRPGDFVAVTGHSGSGKSTLFQLLLGIYQPCNGKLMFCFKDESGTLEAGDIEETQMPASVCTRSLFAYVPQGNTLFSGTLRENFAMFTDSASDEEIVQAARTACIDQLIYELKDGLDTVIGERGIGLSEGQAQRVAVARALLSHAPILLLDESTSALDEETEARLLENISLLKNKTCLIVTHRKAALQICDYRVHIDDGTAKVV